MFPADAKQRVIRHLSELNRRASVATVLTEAYATEGYSRYRWSQVNGIDLMSPTLTGIGGTDRLGLNYAQLGVEELNYYQDIHDQMERDWENAKFIGSCFAGKGLQSVYNKDEDRRRKHKEEVIARKDALIRLALYGEKPRQAKQKGHAIIIAAQTTEELAAQLQHDLRGEKDWHDEVIEAHERHIRESHAQQQDHLTQLVEAKSDEFNGLRVVGGTDRDQPLSPAEVQERILRVASSFRPRPSRGRWSTRRSMKLSKFYRSGASTQTDRRPCQHPEVQMNVGRPTSPRERPTHHLRSARPADPFRR